MPSSVLNWTTPYHQLFPNKSLFPIDLKVFGYTCFVRDVRPQVSKLDPKSLKCIFVRYSRVQKGYRFYYPTLRCYFMFTDVAFFEATPFSLPSTVTSLREDDDVLVYYVSLPVPTPTPITQVYSRHQNPLVSSPTPAASTLDPVSSDDLPIALSKGKCQCVQPISSFVLITVCYHILVLLLYPWILSLFLKLSVRLYLTLVGVVLWWNKCKF